MNHESKFENGKPLKNKKPGGEERTRRRADFS